MDTAKWRVNTQLAISSEQITTTISKLASTKKEKRKSYINMEDYCDNDNGHAMKKEEEDDEEYWQSRAMQLATSSVLPMVMHAVVELGVLDIISKTKSYLSADEIAAHMEFNMKDRTATPASMLDRMLCLLAAHSVLTCTCSENGRRMYGLGRVATFFVPNSDGVSLRPYMSLLQDKVFMDSWFELKPAVIEGSIPFNRVHGMHAFDYPGTDPRFNEVFNNAMISHTTIAMNKILNSYKGFDNLKKVVDVGGGLGVTLKMITSKYPNIKGINFDLPHVIQQAPSYPGVQHVAGDMFESVPEGDAIFMKWILHDWSDDHCLKLLKNCYKALPDTGKVIVVDAILPLIPDSTFATKFTCQSDMIMMTQNPGGKERTQNEFISLATSAGFAGIRFECFVVNSWVMEFFK